MEDFFFVVHYYFHDHHVLFRNKTMANRCVYACREFFFFNKIYCILKLNVFFCFFQIRFPIGGDWISNEGGEQGVLLGRL